jgi:hypothetical protein
VLLIWKTIGSSICTRFLSNTPLWLKLKRFLFLFGSYK